MKPTGLAPITLAMCMLNPAGFMFIDGLRVPPALGVPVVIVVTLLTYVVLWYFWKGRNWARWLVLVTSGLALLNLSLLATASVAQTVVIVVEAALGAFLVVWLNTTNVRSFFTPKPIDRPSSGPTRG